MDLGAESLQVSNQACQLQYGQETVLVVEAVYYQP